MPTMLPVLRMNLPKDGQRVPDNRLPVTSFGYYVTMLPVLRMNLPKDGRRVPDNRLPFTSFGYYLTMLPVLRTNLMDGEFQKIGWNRSVLELSK